MNNRMYFLRVTAIITAISTIAVFASCGKGGGSETTAGSQSVSEALPQEIETAGNTDVTDATSSESTQAQLTLSTPQTTAEPVSTPTAVQASVTPSGLPSTIPDITSYFVNALNDVKSNAVSVTKTYDKTSNYKNVLEGAGALESTAKWLMEKALKPKEPNEVHTGREDIAGSFPPAGAEASPLTADKVRSATFKDCGTYYEIYILMNNPEEAPDKNPPECGGYAGSIGTVMRAEWVSDAAGDYINFNTIDCTYVDSAVTARIDKSTGKMTDIHTDLPCYLVFDEISSKSGLIKVNNAKIGLEFEQKWTVQW